MLTWWRHLLLICAILWSGLGWALQQDDLLPPEQAFQVRLEQQGTLLRVHYQIADGYYLYRDKLAWRVEPEQALQHLPLPTAEEKKDPFFGQTGIYRHRLTTEHQLSTLPTGQWALFVSLQGCADVGVCYPPQTIKLTPQGKPSAWQEWFSSSAPPVNNGGLGEFASSSRWGSLALFFISGLGLALTACMYPMIPIISAIVAGQGSHLTRWRGFWLSMSYVQGMALSYTLIGIAAGLTGSLLSVWLQQPAVMLTASALIVLFALAMFDVIHIQLPAAWQSRLHHSGHQLSGGRLLSVFVMGTLSALIVGPCVAPPLAIALGYIGSTGDAWFGGAALYLMALGLGLPLLLVGTLGGHFLPRAGHWMNRVKAVFGVVMLGLAIYLASPFLPSALPLALWGSLALGCAVFLGLFQRLPRRISRSDLFVRLLALILLLVGSAQWIGALGGSHHPWQPLAFLQGKTANAATQLLPFQKINNVAEWQQALRNANGQPVLLDFYADWCVACKEMEANTLPDPQVQQALQRFVRLKADVTANNSEHQALLKQFGLYGPPGIMLFLNGTERGRIIGFVSAQEFVAQLEKIR